MTWKENFDGFLAPRWYQSHWENGSAFDCIWNPINVFTDNRGLILTLENNDKEGKRYKSGEIFTNEKFKFGTFEVKIKPVFVPGVITSFFLYGNNQDEIDIVEFTGNDDSHMQLTHYLKGVRQNYSSLELPESDDGYYTIKLVWTSEYMDWSINGKRRYRTYDNIPQEELSLVCNLWPVNKDIYGLVEWAGIFEYENPLSAIYSYISVTDH